MYSAFFVADFIRSGLITIVTMAFVLGVMILVHEFGHYAAAKLLGVRVETFSIGFGKRLIGFRRGDTDYRIAAIPLGGYVKMSGENPMDTRTGDKGEFMSHPRWHRFIIAIAGPLMNIVLAVALLTGVFMVHYEHPAYLSGPAVVGNVEKGQPADKAGLQDGDLILRAGDKQNPNWEDLRFIFAFSPSHPVSLAIQRNGQILEKTVTPDPVGPDQVGEIGVDPARPVQVAALEPGKAAEKAGLKPGDTIDAINGEHLYSIEELLQYLRENGTKPVTLTVTRGHQTLAIEVTPFEDIVRGKPQNRVGFVPDEPMSVAKLSFPKAFGASVQENKKYSVLIVELVERMVRGVVPMRQMSGPIGIATAAGQAVREPGWTPLLSLMAAISLNLGIFNLFPIPILDGGVIMLLLVEGIMRRDISQSIKERIYQAAFVFLVLFAVVVIYNDIAKNIVGWTQRLP
jgi:regulator of sigma E protease